MIGKWPEIKLEENEIDYLINNSDEDWRNYNGASVLTLSLFNERNLKLTEEQYQILIEKTCQQKHKTEYICDLLLAVGRYRDHSNDPDYKLFSERNWLTLIEKTPKEYFNSYKLMIIPRLISNIKLSGNCWEAVFKKFDFIEDDDSLLDFEILYTALNENKFDMAVKIAEMIGEDALQKRIKNARINHSFLFTSRPELLKDINSLLDIIKTKKVIDKEVVAGEKKTDLKI